MAITGSVDLGNGLLQVTVDHDPLATVTEVPVGSRIVDANGVYYKKISDTATPTVDVVIDVLPRNFNFNGFLDPENVQESFTDGTLTLQLQPKAPATSFTFYSNGNKYTKTAPDSIVINNTEGIHYIYYDEDGVLQKSTTWDDDYILKYAIVAIIYWDATNGKQILFAREFFHRQQMDGETHRRLHDVDGYGLASGGALNSILVDQDGSLASHCQFGNEASICFDEDAKFTLSTRLSTANIPVYWKEGAPGSIMWRLDETASFPTVKTGVVGEDRAAYNQFTGATWQLTEVANNKFLLAHVAVTNDTDRPFIVIVGEAQYDTISDAREGALAEINDVIIDGLPGPELKFLGTVILQTADSYSNTPKCRIVSTGDGGDYVDLRGEVITRSGSPGSGVPALHASTHESGGSDEIDLTGMTGLLATLQNPTAHNGSHFTAGGDPIAPANIGAEPAFAKNTAFNKNFGSIAGTVCQGNDSRLSDARTPLAHESTHRSGGSDALSVLNLAGFPGGTTNFLRADGSFAAPGGGGGWTATQTLYVAKWGNDSNSGYDPSEPKLTIGSAITKADADGAGVGKPYLIYIMDGGIYTENITFDNSDSYITLFGPGATLAGYIHLNNCTAVNITLFAHRPGTAAYNSSAIYCKISSTYTCSITLKEAQYTSSQQYGVREDSFSGGGSNLIFNCEWFYFGNTSTSAVCFYDDAQGSATINVSYVFTAAPFHKSDNTNGEWVYNIGRLYVSSLFTAGGRLLTQVAGGIVLNVGYLDLNSRAYIFPSATSTPIEGGIGRIENYSATYPIDMSRAEIWGFKNIRVQSSISVRASSYGLLGSIYYPTSSAFNDYSFYQFRIPKEALAFNIRTAIIPSSNESTGGVSILAHFGADDEPYNNHTVNNVNYTVVGAITANDIGELDITGAFTNLAAGDLVAVGLAKRNGSSSATHYMRGLLIRTFVC